MEPRLIDPQAEVLGPRISLSFRTGLGWVPDTLGMLHLESTVVCWIVWNFPPNKTWGPCSCVFPEKRNQNPPELSFLRPAKGLRVSLRLGHPTGRCGPHSPHRHRKSDVAAVPTSHVVNMWCERCDPTRMSTEVSFSRVWRISCGTAQSSQLYVLFTYSNSTAVIVIRSRSSSSSSSSSSSN